MLDGRDRYQIIRKDGKNCFVESLSDAFDIGKAHFLFSSYDLSKPEGDRQTDIINIYIDISEILEFCRKMVSGELRETVRLKKAKGDTTRIQEWLGGTTSEKLTRLGKARADGMCLSRVAKLLLGSKVDFMFVASSGPGEQTEKGLIVPRFAGKGENHVVVSLSWNDLSEIMLMTQVHYEAWLTAWYGKQIR